MPTSRISLLNEWPSSAVTVCGSDPLLLRLVQVTDPPGSMVTLDGVKWNVCAPVFTMLTDAPVTRPGAQKVSAAAARSSRIDRAAGKVLMVRVRPADACRITPAITAAPEPSSRWRPRTGRAQLASLLPLAAIRAGNAYVNVHTGAHPGGEVRANLAGN